MSFSAAQRAELLPHFTDAERALLDELLLSDPTPWRPQPGPQTEAYYSIADVVGFGGAAGGGKSDLAIGKALTQHRKIGMFRRIGTELTGLEDRVAEIIGDESRKGYNGTKKIWRNVVPGVQLEFGSVPNLGDEKGHQGRPKDLLVIDEASNFLEQQVRFLMGWVRSVVKGQRCQTLMCFNPPTDAEGRWIVEFFAPWLRKNHPNPAMPGELRWFAVIDGRDVEVANNRKFVIEKDDEKRIGRECDGERVFDFDPTQYKRTAVIQPQSRTFIPSRVTDNRYLGASYMSVLQSMPEPLRSQMLNGDFEAGMSDSEWQVIPTDWVDAAMARWKPRDKKPPMTQMGVDVARGGADSTVVSRRHEWWFDKLIKVPGKETPDGPAVAGHVVAALRNKAPVNIDVIGVGSSPYDYLHDLGLQIMGVNVSEKSNGVAKSGRLRYFNLRTELVWSFRELLDPQYNYNVELPLDPQLKADLCAFTWTPREGCIYVRSREEIVKLIGRSPDSASAIFLAAMEVPRRVDLEVKERIAQREHNPLATVENSGSHNFERKDHDPLANIS